MPFGYFRILERSTSPIFVSPAPRYAARHRARLQCRRTI